MDKPSFINTQDNALYNKIYGINQKNTKIVNDKSINEYHKTLLSNYDENYLNYKKDHNDYVMEDIIINGDKINIEKFTDNAYTEPISIEKFIEVDRSSNEFKNNICLRKLEFKLLLILMKYLDSNSVRNTNKEDLTSVLDLYQCKKGLSNKHKLDIDWTKLDKIEEGGLLFLNPKPSKSSLEERGNIIKLYKIIYIGKSPHAGRRECIVIRHILFPKYYIAFTGFGGTEDVFANPGGILWYVGHLFKDIIGLSNQNKSVNIQCNEQTITTEVQKWLWDIAELQTLQAIDKIEKDFISWWQTEINSTVKTLDDISNDYCLEPDKQTYCKTNQNKKNTFFYDSCIPKSCDICCDNNAPVQCLGIRYGKRTQNKLSRKIKEIGLNYYNKTNDNFNALKHGRPDISIIGTSLGGGIGTLSILVLIDYFSKKEQKIFNIEATFYNSVKSTNELSFNIMKTYDNIIPINLVNTKLEFMIEPNKKYNTVLNYLQKDYEMRMGIALGNPLIDTPKYEDVQEMYHKFNYGKINHITDIFNFIPGVSIDPYTLLNLGSNFSQIPLTYFYFGCVDTIYKDIAVYNGRICPEYKQLLPDGKINNEDISNKLFKFENYDERNQYHLNKNDFLKLFPKFAMRLHVPKNTKYAMDKIYYVNECNNHGYEY